MSNIRKILKYFIAFLVPIICMVIHMYIRKCYPFGDNTILLGDANAQYYWFEKMLLEKIKNGESILFSWHAGMGFEFYQNFFYYLGSPFNVIAMIIGNWDMELGVVITMLVQIGMCSVTMLYYLGHTSRNTIKTDKVNVPICMTLALVYSMCDYFLAYQYNYIWLISLMLAPLVMLGVENLVDDKGALFYIVILTLVFITNFYFAWFICILSFIWYVDYCKGTRKQIIKKTGKYFLASLWATLLSAFVLVPCYLAVKNRGEMDFIQSDDDFGIWGNAGEFAYSFFWGSPIDQAGHDYFNNNNYIGISILLLSIMYMFNNKFKLCTRIKRLFEIIILCFALNWSALSYVFHGFAMPNSYSSRFSFILSILLLITAYEEIVNLVGNKIIIYVIAILMMTIILGISLKYVAGDGYICVYIVTTLIYVFDVLCLWLYSRKSIKKTGIVYIFLIMCMCEMISNYFIVIGSSQEVSQENIRNTKAWINEYESIKINNEDRKSSWINFQRGMGNSDASIFSSILNNNVLKLFRDFGLSYQVNGRSYTYKGTTPISAMVFNVNNVLTDQEIYFGGYGCLEKAKVYDPYTHDDMYYGIYKNEYQIGLGYMISRNIRGWNADGENPFENQNQYIERAVNIDNVFQKANITDVKKTAFGCEILEDDDLNVTYKNIWPKDGIFMAANTLQFTALEDMHLFMYVDDKMGVITSVYVDDKPLIADSTYIDAGEMINIGYIKKSQTVKLKIANNSKTGYESTTKVYAYKIDDNKMEDALKKSRKSVLSVNYFGNTRVNGEINVTQKGILFTSIPWYKGTTAYVDGTKKEIIKIDGALCGVELDEGIHEVEFRYIPYGLRTGIIISMISLLLALGYKSHFEKIDFNRKRNVTGGDNIELHTGI